jgi:hypothetical protein
MTLVSLLGSSYCGVNYEKLKVMLESSDLSDYSLTLLLINY